MKKEGKAPFRIALYGMDIRTSKTMELYLKGPCSGVAIVVGEAEADIDMIDADHVTAKEILETRRAATPNRPIILLSLEHVKVGNTFFLKKPINAEQVEQVLAKIQAETTASTKVAGETERGVLFSATTESSLQPEPETAAKTVIEESPGIAPNNHEEQTKSAKQPPAKLYQEGGFTSFLGNLHEVDFSSKDQLLNASFDSRQFFLGYVQSAYKTAITESRILQLNSMWKLLLIFPENQEIWIDAEDKQLRAFAGISLNNRASNMALVAADLVSSANLSPARFQDMDTFIWKLAIWTSKGRFPVGLSMQRPVYLERWPNFTRLLITPEALRIAALLVKAPRSPLALADELAIKPEYVFVFISACHTIGLLGQCKRQVDTVFAPEKLKKNKNEGLLSKILSKLRGALDPSRNTDDSL